MILKDLEAGQRKHGIRRMIVACKTRQIPVCEDAMDRRKWEKFIKDVV